MYACEALQRAAVFIGVSINGVTTLHREFSRDDCLDKLQTLSVLQLLITAPLERDQQQISTRTRKNRHIGTHGWESCWIPENCSRATGWVKSDDLSIVVARVGQPAAGLGIDSC